MAWAAVLHEGWKSGGKWGVGGWRLIQDLVSPFSSTSVSESIQDLLHV